MILSTKSIKSWLPWFIIAGLTIYVLMIDKKEPEVIKIPSESGSKEISKPEPKQRIDTLKIEGETKYMPKENPVNKELLIKYEKAIDSIEKLKVFKDAIEERIYTETLEDSIIKITVDSEAIGFLKNQKISYVTKERSIAVLPEKKKPAIYGGAFMSVPTNDNEKYNLGVSIELINDSRGFSVGVDRNINVYLGYKQKF